MIKNISIKHQKKLKALPAGTRQIYEFGVCANCKCQLLRDDIEWSIDNNFLPVCSTDREVTQERIDKLWGHLAQLNLL